jgi:chromosome condensin MukBEF MukE localization factor
LAHRINTLLSFAPPGFTLDQSRQSTESRPQVPSAMKETVGGFLCCLHLRPGGFLEQPR